MIPWEFSRVTLQIHGYLVAKQDLNNFVWAITIASRKGYLSPYPLIFQLTRYLEPGVDRYLIYKFQIHKELEDQGYYTNQPGIFGSLFRAKNLSFLIEAEHHHVENLKPHLLRLHSHVRVWSIGVVVIVGNLLQQTQKTRDLIKEKIRIMVNSIHCQSFTRYLLDRVPPHPGCWLVSFPPGVLDLNLNL